MLVKPLFGFILLPLFVLASGSTAIAQLLVPQSSPSPNKLTIPLTKTDLQATEVVGFDDQGRQLTFQIRDAEVDPKDPEQETYLYTVFYRDNNQTLQNLCRGDANYAPKAIALQGSWDNRGAYHPEKKLVTFSCTNGALAKCIRFGYKPWKTFNGRSLQDYHQACVRMVRADYCGDGTSHTHDGTLINFYDRLGVRQQGVSPNMSFEAAWGVDGAQYINHLRWPQELAYVQRVCPERLAAEGKGINQFSTTQQVQQNFPSALVFNDSVVRKPNF